jgi:CRP-like cAMP-binding protein
MFRVSTNFGDNDMLLNQRRLGTAKSTTICQLYKLTKTQLEVNLEDYPQIRRELMEYACEKNLELIKHRISVLQKQPLYGL